MNFDMIKVCNEDMVNIPNSHLVGRTFTGLLEIGCFGSGIHCDDGTHFLCETGFRWPDELMCGATYGGSVPVTIKVELNSLEQVEFNVERIEQ